MHIELIDSYPNLTPILNYLNKCKIHFNNDVEKLGLATLIDGYSKHEIDKNLNTPTFDKIILLYNYFINGQKLDAIKEVRQLTGYSLGDAKNVIDHLFYYLNKTLINNSNIEEKNDLYELNEPDNYVNPEGIF